MSLFASEDGFECFDLKNGSVLFNRNFLSNSFSQELFKYLENKAGWEQQQIKMFGKVYDIPRLTAWYGEPDAGYVYSGIINKPMPCLPELKKLNIRIEEACSKWDSENKDKNPMNAEFNSLLLNKYRDGNDKVSWHCDDEKEFGQNPVIASISLGETRKFQIRNLDDKSQKSEFLLNSGSLIIMKDAFQHNWEHQVPVQKPVKSSRINLTFRKVIV